MFDPFDDQPVPCHHCRALIGHRAYSLGRALETVDFNDPREDVPTVTPKYAQDIGCYCSEACRESAMPTLLQEHGVTLPADGAGVDLEETCARCSGPVPMTEPHWTYTAEVMNVEHGYPIVEDSVCLAVVCQGCQPPRPFPGSWWDDSVEPEKALSA